MFLFQWRSQGRACMGPPHLCCALPLISKDQDTLIEQSYILIKQLVGQVLLCQETDSGYATALLLSVKQGILHLTAVTIYDQIAVEVG